jgi:hypothetical protein
VKGRLANVHLPGRLLGGQWVLDDAPYGLHEALDRIRHKWHYEGLLTVEPRGLRQGDWNDLVDAMLPIGEKQA